MTTTNRFPPLKYLVAGAIAACVLTWFAIRLAREKAQTTPSEAASTAGEFDLSLPVNVDAMDRLDEGDPRRQPVMASSGAFVAGTLKRAADGGWPLELGNADLVFSRDGEMRTIRPSVDGTWAGRLAIGAWSVHLERASDVFEVTPSHVFIDEGTDSNALVWLPLPSVSGRVVRCDGSGIEGIGVHLRGYSAVEPTTGTGRFSLRAFPDIDYRVMVAETSLPSGFMLPWWQDLDARSLGRPAFFQATLEPDPLCEITLELLRMTRVLVLDNAGQPWANATLSVRSAQRDASGATQGVNYVVTTDQAGMFERQMAFGDYEARVFPSSRSYTHARPDPVEFSLGCGASEPDFVLHFRDGLGTRIIAGVARDSLGNPMHASFGIWKVRNGDPQESFQRRAGYHASGSARTDENGAWRLDRFPPAEFILVRSRGDVAHQGLVHVDSSEYIVVDTRSGDAFVEWIFDGYEPAVIFGTLPMADYAAYSMLRLTVAYDSWALDHRFRKIEADGSFRIEKLPPGEAIVTLSGFLLESASLPPEEHTIDAIAAWRVSVVEGLETELFPSLMPATNENP